MKTFRIFALVIFSLSLNAVVYAQDGIREVSRLYNLWHSPEAVAAEGDYVYVSCGVPGLQIFDVSDPENIEIVGSLNLPCLTYDVIVSGDLAFVACYDAEAFIRIVDISEPANPIQIGVIDSLDNPDPYECAVQKFAKEGDYFFVMTYSYIHIFDVSNPAEPQLISSFGVSIYWPRDFEISEHYIYIRNTRNIEDRGCMRVYNVSDPENPEEAGILYGEQIRDVAVRGNYAFATVDSALLVIDVSDVEDMQVVTLFEIDDCACNHIIIKDNVAFVSDGNHICLIDISGPAQPELLGIIESNDDERYYNIATTNDMMFATERNNGLRVFDITDMSEPQEIWSFTPLVGHVRDVELKGNYAFLASEEAGLRVVDISNPENPAEVGSCSFQGEATALTIDGDYAYIAAGEDGLRILNISDPEEPFEASFYDYYRCYDVAIKDDFAYLTGFRIYFSVIDISDPTDPVLVDTCWTEGSSRNVAVVGDYLYVTVGLSDLMGPEWGNLNIYDISNPSNLEPVGQLETEYLLKTVLVEDNIAYVYYLGDIGNNGPESAGILIVDVSEPANPQLLAEYELNYNCYVYPDVDDLVIIDDVLIVTNSLEGLHFIDVSDPEHPFESEHLFTPGIASGLAVFDHYTCVADYSNFGIYDCSEYFSVPYDKPDAPEVYTLLTNYPNPFNSSTTITYNLPHPEDMSLIVYDQLGREVSNLFEGHNQAGMHSVAMSADELPSGLYFIRLEAEGKVDVRKIVLLR
jgi:hypothetical protein